MAANANNGPNNINFIRPYRPNPGRCRHFDHFWIPHIQINWGVGNGAVTSPNPQSPTTGRVAKYAQLGRSCSGLCLCR